MTHCKKKKMFSKELKSNDEKVVQIHSWHSLKIFFREIVDFGRFKHRPV